MLSAVDLAVILWLSTLLSGPFGQFLSKDEQFLAGIFRDSCLPASTGAASALSRLKSFRVSGFLRLFFLLSRIRHRFIS